MHRHSYIHRTVERWLSKEPQVEQPARDDNRVYVDDPSEVPQGAKLEQGPEGGMFYRPETVEDFENFVEAQRNKVFEEHDELHPEHPRIEKAQEISQEYEAVADSEFHETLAVLEQAGTDIKGATHRVKDPVSMAEKVDRKDNYESVEGLKDILGMRIYASPETIRDATQAIQDHFGDQIIEEENYIEEPKDGYYRAYHMNFEFDDGKVGEFQMKIPSAGEISDVGWKVVYKQNYDHGEKSEEEKEAERQEVADCLTASMDMVMGEQTDKTCTQRAYEIITDVMNG